MTTKKALVTGASEGIGRILARRLSESGYTVTAVARNEARLRELGLPYLTADLSTADGVREVRGRLETGEFDLLVNNAGFSRFGRFEQVPFEEHRKMVRLNCEALAELSHAFLKTAKSGDALLNVASTVAFNSIPYNGLYSATKAFVLELTEALWFEQKDRGVYVFALCPGYTLTEFTKRAGAVDKPEFRRFAQTPEQVVGVALRALKKRSKPVVVSGTQNRALIGLQKLLPRATSTRFAGRVFAKLLKED